MSVQYLCIPNGAGSGTEALNSGVVDDYSRGYDIFNTHNLNIAMVQTDTDRTTNSGTVKDTKRFPAYYGAASATDLPNSIVPAGSFIGIINKNGHMAPISDTTPSGISARPTI